MNIYQPETTNTLVIDGVIVDGNEPFVVYEALARIDSWKSAVSTEADGDIKHTLPKTVCIL